MPALENPKHEEFALLLARNVKQGEAYIRAGYAENKGAASRLATSPVIKERVSELRKEIAQKINTAMTVPTEQNFESLAEMGLTMEWVAKQYKEIYEQALNAGAFAPANSAVQSIQKLIEIERNGKGGTAEEEKKQDVNINALANVLGKITDLVAASKAPGPVPAPIRDITPVEDSE